MWLVMKWAGGNVAGDDMGNEIVMTWTGGNETVMTWTGGNVAGDEMGRW